MKYNEIKQPPYFIYVAAPMTGIENFNRDAVMDMVDEINKHGEGLISALHTAWMGLGLPWESYMDISYTLIDHADVIILLEGWRSSRGCCNELEYALLTVPGCQSIYEAQGYALYQLSPFDLERYADVPPIEVSEIKQIYWE